MANGWAGDGAVQQQIENTVEDAVDRVRRNLPSGESRVDCADCGEPIPGARRKALPGVQLCVNCQAGRDTEADFSVYNRRGSKDSQLR